MKVDVGESTVNRWESGEREPESLSQLARLARALGVSVDWLLDMPNAETPDNVQVIDQKALARLFKSLNSAVAEVRRLAADAPLPGEGED